ncbi:MAG: hypothetical protein WCS89_00075 [Candidatus Paceibacterota bacterium]
MKTFPFLHKKLGRPSKKVLRFRKAMDDAFDERMRHSMRRFGRHDFIYFRSIRKATREFFNGPDAISLANWKTFQPMSTQYFTCQKLDLCDD